MSAAQLKTNVPRQDAALPPAPLGAPVLQERRGSMRPERLVSSRTRLAGQVLTHGFRLLDVTALTVIAVGLNLVAGRGFNLTGVAPYVVATAVLALCLNSVNAYAFRGRESIIKHALRIAVAFGGVAVLCEVGAVIVERDLNLMGLWLSCGFAAVLLVHMTGFSLVARLRKSGQLVPNVVIVGGGANAERLIQAALRTREVNVLGLFDDRTDRARPILGVPILGDTSMLLSHRALPFVDRIVITVPSAAEARVRQIVDRVSILPNPVTLFVDTGETVEGAKIARLVDHPLAYVSGRPDDPARATTKRIQDLVVGSLALLLALPIMGLVALAVKLDSPGPAFFRQRRHGFNNEEIVVWKFRSMRVEAADARAARQISVNDDRVTRVGRFIRRTSLDELPQIFNVLSGEMSLVGPRPHAIGMMTGDVESSKLVWDYAHRHRMKPGMTGWAAIKGSRGAIDTPDLVRRRVALDVEYIERQSFWLDLYIMLMTIPCLLGDSETVR